MVFTVYSAGSNRITQAVVGAHEGGVFSLCTTKDGNLLSGGGKDRKVIEWDNTYSKTGREAEVSKTVEQRSRNTTNNNKDDF